MAHWARVSMKALFDCVTHWLIKLFSPKQVFLVRYEFNEPSTKSIMHGFNFKRKPFVIFVSLLSLSVQEQTFLNSIILKERIKNALKSLVKREKFNALYSTKLTRCQHTKKFSIIHENWSLWNHSLKSHSKHMHSDVIHYLT